MGRRSCSPWPESAWGRVMMAPPVDVAGLRPRLGDVEAPPKPRSSLSSMAEAEPEPLGRARRRPSAEARAESEPWGRAKRSSSSSRAEPESEPWVGRSGVRRLPGLSPSPSPGVRRSGVSHGAFGRARLPVRLTLSSGTAVGVAQAVLSFCQTGQWSGGHFGSAGGRVSG